MTPQEELIVTQAQLLGADIREEKPGHWYANGPNYSRDNFFGRTWLETPVKRARAYLKDLGFEITDDGTLKRTHTTGP